jgi:hypothetical protein
MKKTALAVQNEYAYLTVCECEVETAFPNTFQRLL